MKSLHRYLLLVVAALAGFAACDSYDADDHKFGNVVYLDVSKTNEVQLTTFSNNRPKLEKPFQATLAYPEGTDVAVTIEVDPSLVALYNTRYGTSWPLLDAKYYELTASQLTIPAGKTTSEVVTLRLRGLMGEDEAQTGALPIDQTYLLPVRIGDASLSVLSGSDVAYYVVKRSSAITTAAQLTDNWIEFASLDKYTPQSMAWNNLRAFTYEAFVYIDDFNLLDEQQNPVNISTVMGIEDYALMRIGDTNFEREQIQFDGSGVGFGKFPGRDATKKLEKGRWYHLACTFDMNERVVRILVDGRVQSESYDMGPSVLTEKNVINLARRALYELWDKETNPDQRTKWEELKYNTLVDARQFFISYSYNDYRPLNGKIAEARVWSVARTPEQIRQFMYGIEEPQNDPTLIGYWKFNEGSGNKIKDYSQYGHDGLAHSDIVWPDGIEIPILNQEEN